MFALAEHTFIRLYRQKFLRLAFIAALGIPIIYDLGIQGFAKYSIPIDAISHPAGLANFMAMILAIYLAVTMLPEDKRIGFTKLMMTKAISPWKYIAGRMLGSAYMIVVVWVILSAAICLGTAIRGNPITGYLLFSLSFALAGQLMVFSLAVLLSQLLSPLLAGMLVLLLNDRVFYSFALNIDSWQGSEFIKNAGQLVTKIAYFAVPQVSNFALWGTPRYELVIDPIRVMLSAAYAVAYILLTFTIGVIIFGRSKW